MYRIIRFALQLACYSFVGNLNGCYIHFGIANGREREDGKKGNEIKQSEALRFALVTKLLVLDSIGTSVHVIHLFKVVGPLDELIDASRRRVVLRIVLMLSDLESLDEFLC